ncbi:hypothetical protein LC040_02875 [Bacillus tianshenii]|nr:hypothetical protein LC040_02875 [Bacillus tianshenii]
MDSFTLVLKYVAQGSLIIGGVLLVYWLQFTEEGKRAWDRKIKNLSSPEVEHRSNLKNGSILLKAWLTLFGVFFLSIVGLIMIALFT